MTIPAYHEFYRAVLETLSDGQAHLSKEVMAHCAEVFHISKEEQKILLPSNRQTVLANRIGWARTYLKKAGLIRAIVRGKYKIIDRGMKALQDKSQVIDNTYLARFREFRDFIKASSDEASGSKMPKKISVDTESRSEQTPQEIIHEAYQRITLQLADDLMTQIMTQSPAFFEQLVMDLLKKMGYGGAVTDSIQVTGKPGDEGIDGIIRQDALGFDKIYVQAKRWADTHPVGEPDIQQFAGALLGKGATKGLFITTSHFSKAAREYVGKYITAKIVLVDGMMLTRLMIQYNLGVSIVQCYEIKRVDSDYFTDEDS